MSSVFAGPPFIVDGPLPVPPPHRLIDVATRIPDGGDPHWRNGAQVWNYSCRFPNAIAPCLIGSDAIKAGTTGNDESLPDFGAFTVYVPIQCTARGVGDEEEFVNRLIRAFTAVESAAVEIQISQGDPQPLNPFFADANADVLNGGAASTPSCALALLENRIADTAKAGLIHASPGGVTALASSYLVESRSGRLFTVGAGTEVVVGHGYQYTVPTGQPALNPGESWLFATGPVSYYSGEVVLTPGTIGEALDRANNVVRFLAERDYLVYWDTCLQAAALVDFCP